MTTREAEESHSQGNEIWTVSSIRMGFWIMEDRLQRRLLSCKAVRYWFWNIY